MPPPTIQTFLPLLRTITVSGVDAGNNRYRQHPHDFTRVPARSPQRFPSACRSISAHWFRGWCSRTRRQIDLNIDAKLDVKLGLRLDRTDDNTDRFFVAPSSTTACDHAPRHGRQSIIPLSPACSASSRESSPKPPVSTQASIWMPLISYSPYDPKSAIGNQRPHLTATRVQRLGTYHEQLTTSPECFIDIDGLVLAPSVGTGNTLARSRSRWMATTRTRGRGQRRRSIHLYARPRQHRRPPRRGRRRHARAVCQLVNLKPRVKRIDAPERLRHRTGGGWRQRRRSLRRFRSSAIASANSLISARSGRDSFGPAGGQGKRQRRRRPIADRLSSAAGG